MIFWNFEQKTGLPRSEIYLHLDEFVNALRQIFGLGLPLVERTVVKSIEQTLGSKKELDPFDFTGALKLVRRHLSEVS